MSVIRTLCSEIVDFAGVFPPAMLDLSMAVARYAEYREGDDAWMLGRFVLPAAQLDDLADRLGGRPQASRGPWQLCVLLGTAIETDLANVMRFRERRDGLACVETLEVKLDSANEIGRAARLIDRPSTLFVEIPVGDEVAELIAAIAKAGARAKIRTGGVTPQAFPTAVDVARFIRACVEHRCAFKATAGLHHLVRGQYAVSPEPGSVHAWMFGYLNVFLAAAFIRAGMPETDAVAVLLETDLAAFWSDATRIGWRNDCVSESDLADMRSSLAISFGSCSFREPINELARIAAVE